MEARSYKTFTESECNIDYGKVLLEIYDTVVAFEGGKVACDPLKYIKFFDSLPNDFGSSYDFLNSAAIYYKDVDVYEEMITEIKAFLAGGAAGSNAVYEFRIKRYTGYEWVRAQVVALLGDNRAVVACFKDIDKQKRASILAEERTRRDPGTDLFNRKAVVEKITEMMSTDERGTLMMIDIDDLKGLNDEYGHLQGDAAIRMVAGIIDHYAGHYKPYKSAIGRLGGDEFVAYLSDCDADDATEIAKGMLLAARHDRVGDSKACVSLSIGIAQLSDCERKEFDELFNLADTACYTVKTRGKNMFACYEPSMGQFLGKQATRRSTIQKSNVYKATLEELSAMLTPPINLSDNMDRVMAITSSEFALDRTYVMVLDRPVPFAELDSVAEAAPRNLLCKWYSGGVFQNEPDTVDFITSLPYLKSFNGLTGVYDASKSGCPCAGGNSPTFEFIDYFKRNRIVTAVHALILVDGDIGGVVAFESFNPFNTDVVAFLAKAVATSCAVMIQMIAQNN